MSDRTESYASRQAGQRDEIAVIVSTVDKQQQKYADILPSNVKWPDFRNAFLVAVQTNPRLLDADRQSLWLALQKAASAGLKPDGQESALVIFGDDSEDEDGKVVASTAKGKKKVQFLPMVWGITKQMRNTGNIASVRAKVIYKGERVIVTDENGTETYKHERVIEHGSSIDETDENIVGAYAVVAYKDGFWDAEFMSLRQLMRVKAVSKAKKGPWLTFFPQQCMKTPLKRLSLRVEKSAVNERYFQTITEDETIGPVIEGDQASDLMGEFTQERQAASPQQPQRSNGVQREADQQQEADEQRQANPEPREQQKDLEQPANKAAADKKKPMDEPVKEETKLEAKHQDGGTQQFDHYALDEVHGEEIVGADGVQLHFTHPGDFALWYVERYRMTKNKVGLKENNADALDDARLHKAAALILDTLDAPPPPVEEQNEEQKPPAAPNPLHVPMAVLPNGRPNLPKYCLAIGTALKTITTDDHLRAWLHANADTLGKVPAYGAYAMKLDGLIKAAGEGLVQAADAKIIQVDEDEDLVATLIKDLNSITLEDQYDSLIQKAATKTLARRMTKERPDLRKRLAEADNKAFDRVKLHRQTTKPPEEPVPPADDAPPPRDDEIPWDRMETPA